MRTFHLCLSPDTIDAEPGLLETARQAGIGAIWITGFLYGYWHYPPERIARARQAVERLGLAAHIANVPLGHPGDSLGARSGDVPLTPPPHWRLAQRWDGAAHAGTSLHAPATAENADALRRLQALGFTRVFLDDDFRLAVSPGAIGGCFCDAHRAAFLQRFGGSQRDWDDLRADARDRELTPRLRAWIDFTCDELSACFRHMQAAAPDIQLGVMVMYLGAEKAGIRLSDYAGAPLRVGELMFDDASFAPVKGKTDELFSALFHRRFVAPELAYSETTAFPADRLSARHLAAKMNVSLIADVRHTLFMSGLTPFPENHWETLAPAMRLQAALHPRLAGHSPRGPFKHYWGEHARCAGEDIPYSLFLALGVPFEVTDQLAPEGWTFLCDADARGLDARPARPGACVIRPSARPEAAGVMPVEESLEALFAFRRGILPQLRGVPFVEEEWPVMCAWYPAARAVLLWNLAERAQRLTVRLGDAARAVDVDGLGVALLTDVG